MTPDRNGTDLAYKIARLVEEKGWNQEDFARIAHLNRHTVRHILHAEENRRLRNATVSQCAEALGLTVSELRTQSLDRLLLRMHGKAPADEEALKLLYDTATLPELVHWLQQHPDRVRDLHADDIEDILNAQQPGGILERFGVEAFMVRLERRRKLMAQVRFLAGTEQLDFLEKFVTLLYEKQSRVTMG